jgi:anion-transporting  ArsA/GET3 family ATPase
LRSQHFQRRFVIVSGKGGVGRSTVCAALGLAAARYGLRTCIVQLNTRDDVGSILGGHGSSYEPVQLDPHLPLYAAMLRPQEALREYGVMKLKFKMVQHIVFENDVMRRLLRMIPGMNELVLLGKAWHMEEQDKRPDGTPTWDLLVIDAPATGHGVSLLRLPQVILQAVPFGPMAEDARRMKTLLEDPSRTALHVVTLPQDLPASEALELSEQARTVLGVPTGYLFINRVLPPLLNEAQRRVAKEILAKTGELPHGGALVHESLESVLAWEQWRAAQQVQIQRLHRLAQLPIVELPHLFEPIGRAQIERLADLATAGMEAADAREPGAVR